MSRFYKSAVSSDSESESESSEEEQVQQRAPASKALIVQSDEEDDVKRVVRSEKEKRYEELKNILKVLRNHKKIKDMANVLSDFEDLTKAFDKAKKVVEKEGIPRFYTQMLVELDDFVNECWEDREGRKQLSKQNSRGLTTLRQKFKKYIREFEKPMAEYRENPVEEPESASEKDISESEESDDDNDDDGPKFSAADFLKKSITSKAKKETMDEESSDDDDLWKDDDSDDDDSISSSSDEGGNLADKFKKKTKVEGEKFEVKEKKKKDRKKDKKKGEEDDGGGWEEVQRGAPMVVHERPKMFSKDSEVTHENVCKKLNEIIAARGKKGTDRNEQIDLLKELDSISSKFNLGPAMHIKILFHIVAAIYDYNPNIATCMRGEMWEKCLGLIEELLSILETTPELSVGENFNDESESLSEAPYKVRGCVLTMTERMDEEFIKMLQACDAHSTEYVDRLKDEQRVCTVIGRLQKLIEKKQLSEEVCRVYILRIKHIYYKFDFRSHEHYVPPESGTLPADYEDSHSLMAKLCKYIYVFDSTDRIRTRAILCHIYHHALHDRWYEARDLMLMSHLQDSIHHSDVPTQIMYNRAMVQLGLCAFRQGMTKDAHNCLVDIQSGGRAKELLAQGLLLQRQHERTAEQEKIEKRRQLPYHMHINLELLECVYLVSAMLLEIPYMAAHELEARRRMISKNFHHVLRLSERQPLVGPPESMREHVVAASKAMKTGDWRACRNFIVNDKMNAKVWDLFHSADAVRDMMTRKIQEESLRTYLFTYSSIYDSISLETLSDMFELEKAVVHSTISKMIINEELMASLDEPTQTVCMHRTEPTRLQAMALQLAEKVGSLVENNERIMEMKQGNFFNYQKMPKDNYQKDNQGYRRDGRGWGKGGNNHGYQNQNRGWNKSGGQGSYQNRSSGQNKGWGQQNSRRTGGVQNRQRNY